MIFSGPVQPPMLAAALASAKLHLEPRFQVLQSDLMKRISLVNALCREADIPLANEAPSPIFFVRCGPVDDTFQLLHALRARGFYACAGMFPAVPHDKSGPRFTVSLHNEEEDICEFIEALGREAAHTGVRFIDRTSHKRRVSDSVAPPQM